MAVDDGRQKELDCSPAWRDQSGCTHLDARQHRRFVR
jgi:hypothetical protein